MRKATADRTIIALLFTHIALLILFAFFRCVDGDEGFYLSAAQQVSEGRLPYIDFFFPQMPYLPIVQSIVAGYGFATLYLSRLLGILPAILGLLLFVRIVISLVSDRKAAMLAVGLYALSGLLLAWHTPAKTYAWTDLLLLMSFWGLVQIERTRRQFWVAVSVVALVLAVNFRLVLAAAVLPYLFGLWRVRSSVRRSALIGGLLGGLIVSIPSINLFVIAPDRFMFDNFWFHTMRDPSLNLWSGIWQRVETIGKLAINPQIWVLVAALVAAMSVRRSESKGTTNPYWQSPSGLAALFALTLSLVYLLPSPIHQQYFVQAVPFVILASLPSLERLSVSERVFSRWSNERALLVGAVVYCLTFVAYLAYYPYPFRESVTPYRMSNVSALCEYVRNYSKAGPVYSEWSAVTVLSGREGMRGLEFVGFDYAVPVADSVKRHYRLPVNEDLAQVIRDRQPVLYVVWNAPDKPLQAVADSNYIEAKRFDKWVVYERRDTAGVISK